MTLPYTITSVTDSQIDDPSGQDVINTYDVFFAIPGKGYSSDVQVPKGSQDVVAAVKTAVETEVDRVEGILALSTAPPPAA